MEKIFIAAVIILSLAAAASAQALHVVHLHILKERNASKFCRFKVYTLGVCDADEVGKATTDGLRAAKAPVHASRAFTPVGANLIMADFRAGKPAARGAYSQYETRTI